MGVTGLWKLIEASGQPVPLETLENKVLAVDISIWLHQVVKGFQDNKGGVLPNAHLLGLFHRLCKLLYYRIRPIFVFDGGVPQIKIETIAKRNQSRNKILSDADRLQNLLLQSLAKENVVKKALGANVASLVSPTKLGQQNKKKDDDDLFKLPELPESCSQELNLTGNSSCSLPESDSSIEEQNERQAYQTNLQSIDINSAQFKALPADVRHEILTDIKETRKQSSWGRLHELPAKSDDFSTFQMRRLLKRRQVQVSLEEAEKQMEGKSLTLNELQSLLTEDGVLPTSNEHATKQIVSDENTRFLLVRDIRKAIEKAAKNEETQKKEEENHKQAIEKEEKCIPEESLGKEYDDDLEQAIKMSLECNSTSLYKDEDYECDNLKLRKEQRHQLANAAQSLARTYMIEYGGLNNDEFKELLERTQGEENLEACSFNFKHTEKFIVSGEHNPPSNTTVLENTQENKEKINSQKEKQDDRNAVEIMSDSDDDDFIEVSEDEECKSNEMKAPDDVPKREKLEIVIDLTSDQMKESDDIFADIFTKKETSNDSSNAENIQTLVIVEHSVQEIKNTKMLATTSPNNELSREESKNAEQFKNKPESSNNLKSILNKLKNDLENVPKVTLNDLQLGENTVLSENKKEVMLETKDETEGNKISVAKNNVKNECSPKADTEVIEIPDESDKDMKTSPHTTKTPTKIDEYFKTKYIIKRTPEKPLSETKEGSPPPKVKSPFFVNKSPRSGEKKRTKKDLLEDEESSPIAKQVCKSLFDKDASTSKSAEKLVQHQLEEAAQLLKDNKTREELESLATELCRNMSDIETERNKQNRMGISITEKMNTECMQLLRIFGIPYVVAPMEAEAQCAFLNAVKLTDGTITDDSDIWLFGGRTVYKNFFNQKKHVMEFTIESIEKNYSVDRDRLIQLAILVGSDYTAGISGVGAVTAMEILASFTTTPAKPNETTKEMSVLSTLRRFREWFINGTKIGSYGKTALRNKLKNIEISEGFPSIRVVEAYLNPKVDDSQARFTWGTPDEETIREFARKNFGWNQSKTDEILIPVLKKLNEKKQQTSIKNYFNVKSSLPAIRELKVSKRVQKAINTIAGGGIPEPELEKKKKPASKGKISKPESESDKTNPKKPKPSASHSPQTSSKKRPSLSSSGAEQNESEEDGDLNSAPCGKKAKFVDAKSTNIPQREKDLIEMQKRKEKAAEIFKNSQNARQ